MRRFRRLICRFRGHRFPDHFYVDAGDDDVHGLVWMAEDDSNGHEAYRLCGRCGKRKDIGVVTMDPLAKAFKTYMTKRANPFEDASPFLNYLMSDETPEEKLAAFKKIIKES